MNVLTMILLCVSSFSFGLAIGTGLATWYASRVEWTRAVRRWEARRGQHWQLMYRSGPRVGSNRNRGSCAVREPLTASK